jgi:hypothetical protein
MEALIQVLAALYVALAEATGSPGVANRVLRDAIADQVIHDPMAVGLLQGLAHDEDVQLAPSSRVLVGAA